MDRCELIGRSRALTLELLQELDGFHGSPNLQGVANCSPVCRHGADRSSADALRNALIALMGLQGTVRAYGLTSGFRAKCTMRNAAWRNTWQAGVRSVQRAMRPIKTGGG